ncbi:hypothetical protein BC828DRAFT_377647 [Blastocladiella britannica]|nr:hypothetical protein BC828DRAFT_377647 [Blastocladiella britannica]
MYAARGRVAGRHRVHVGQKDQNPAYLVVPLDCFSGTSGHAYVVEIKSQHGRRPRDGPRSSCEMCSPSVARSRASVSSCITRNPASIASDRDTLHTIWFKYPAANRAYAVGVSARATARGNTRAASVEAARVSYSNSPWSWWLVSEAVDTLNATS